MDIYGEPITLQYEGSPTFNTKFGGTCSMFTGIVLILVSMINGIKFFGRQDPDFASALQVLDLNQFEGMHLGTIGEGAFDLSLGLPEPLDPSIGYFTAEYRQYFRDERKRSLLDTPINEKIKDKVELKECQDDVNFLHA